jgi:hypothetical protein
MPLDVTNAGRVGLPSYMWQGIAPLVSPNVTKCGLKTAMFPGRTIYVIAPLHLPLDRDPREQLHRHRADGLRPGREPLPRRLHF